jgi:hypothetical protein
MEFPRLIVCRYHGGWNFSQDSYLICPGGRDVRPPPGATAKVLDQLIPPFHLYLETRHWSRSSPPLPPGEVDAARSLDRDEAG